MAYILLTVSLGAKWGHQRDDNREYLKQAMGKWDNSCLAGLLLWLRGLRDVTLWVAMTAKSHEKRQGQ